MFVVNFIAHYWWVWLIITICCFGIFLTNLTASPAAREALREAMSAADDDKTDFAAGARVANEAVQKKQAEINKQAGSLVTDLGFIGSKVFGVLLIVGVLLRLFGFGA